MYTDLQIDINNPIQKKSLDKFSFPYNGEGEVTEWINKVKPYAPFIHDIYFACPNQSNFFSDREPKNYSEKCIQLCKELEKTDWQVRTVKIVEKAVEFFKTYNIYGCVVTDFDIARLLHEQMPELVLNTSCNVAQYQLSSLTYWKETCGIDLINPNRPMSRNISYLKDLKKHGFKIKLLINEKCSLICPNYICSCSVTEDSICSSYICKTTPLQSCIVLPRWLDILDKYVDIYKLTGRLISLDFTLRQLERYIARSNDFYYDELHPGCNVPINVKEIPDDLLYCNYTDCSKCNKCHDLMVKFAQRYINSLPKVTIGSKNKAIILF